jgi:hypothetical protein
VPDAIKLIVNIKCMKSEVTVKINLKRPNHNYPPCNIVGRHLTFPVTTTPNIPWVEFVFPTLRFGRLCYKLLISKSYHNLGFVPLRFPAAHSKIYKHFFFYFFTYWLLLSMSPTNHRFTVHSLLYFGRKSSRRIQIINILIKHVSHFGVLLYLRA